jgi:hypothetical protein
VETTVEMTREEILRYIDEAARRRVGRSAKDLLRAYRRGELTDPGPVADLLVLADLLPDDDPVFAAA